MKTETFISALALVCSVIIPIVILIYQKIDPKDNRYVPAGSGKIIYQSHLDKPVEVTLDIAHRARPMWEYDVARMDSVSQKLYFNILEKQINDFKVPALCIQSGYSKNG